MNQVSRINREEYEALKRLPDKWKWVTRDGDNYLWGYKDRPTKLGGTQRWDDLKDGYYAFLGTNLLHFIQWEDEEPYSIAELIEEYEEATRVAKKNIEWAKSQIDLRDTGTTDMGDPQFYVDIGLRFALDFLNQLDKPEVNSQIGKLANFIMNEVEGEPSQSEGAIDTAIRIIKSYQNQETLSQDWIHKHSYQVAYDGMPDDTEVVYVDDLQNLLMPKQKELEVKIQELIEKYKKEDGKHSNPENAWIDEFITDLGSLIGKKKKEPKYYVDLDAVAYVAKWVGDGSVEIYSDSILGNDEFELQLTEQEIKDYDPRFWSFAVKVEELEGWK